LHQASDRLLAPAEEVEQAAPVLLDDRVERIGACGRGRHGWILFKETLKCQSRATTVPRGSTITGQRASSITYSAAALIRTRPGGVPGFEPTTIRSTAAVARGARAAPNRVAIASAVSSTDGSSSSPTAATVATG